MTHGPAVPIPVPKKVLLGMMKVGVTKSSESLMEQIVLGWLAGVYIGFAGILSLTCGGGLSGKKIDSNGQVISVSLGDGNPALIRLAMGMTFPIALLLIVVTGGELFTGNTMYMTAALLQKKIYVWDLLKNWLISYFANLAGALTLAYFLGYGGAMFEKEPWFTFTQRLAEAKVSYTFSQTFVRGIAANWCVCLALWFGLAADNQVDKIIAIWWPTFTFVASGFEHSIANMFFIPMGMLLGADVSVNDFINNNLIPSTLGNVVGGSIMVAFVYWAVYRHLLYEKEKDPNGKSIVYDAEKATKAEMQPLGR